MRARGLTELTVRKISTSRGKRIELWDGKLPGFGVRVSPSGQKSFVLMYYVHGRKRRATLGRYPHLSLAKARAKALSMLGQVANGADPESGSSQPALLSFEVVVEEFLG